MMRMVVIMMMMVVSGWTLLNDCLGKLLLRNLLNGPAYVGLLLLRDTRLTTFLASMAFGWRGGYCTWDRAVSSECSSSRYGLLLHLGELGGHILFLPGMHMAMVMSFDVSPLRLCAVTIAGAVIHSLYVAQFR